MATLAQVFDYCNGMISTTWPAGCRPTTSSIQEEITEERGRNVTKEGFKLILLNRSHFYSAIHQLKHTTGQLSSESPVYHSDHLLGRSGDCIGRDDKVNASEE